MLTYLAKFIFIRDRWTKHEGEWDKKSYGRLMYVRDVNKKRFWLHKIQTPVTIFVHNVGDLSIDIENKK